MLKKPHTIKTHTQKQKTKKQKQKQKQKQKKKNKNKKQKQKQTNKNAFRIALFPSSETSFFFPSSSETNFFFLCINFTPVLNCTWIQNYDIDLTIFNLKPNG